MTEVSVAPSLSAVERLSDAITAEYLERYGLLPLTVAESVVRVASWHETPDEQALDDLRLIFGVDTELFVFPEASLRQLIVRLYGTAAITAADTLDEMEAVTDVVIAPGMAMPALALDDVLHLANEAPVVRLVNLLLVEALEARASDVHLETFANFLQVRYRIDGAMVPAPSPPAALAPAIVSRLKIMAELDVTERRIPQDGRIRLKLQRRDVDVRVSTVPTLHGESVVLRLLDKERGLVALTDLGMNPAMLAAFQRAIALPNGIVLVTGPTGSGKTTTLYAAMQARRTGHEKILTVEDPIEYELEGVAQVPVNQKLGVTFATALRALLRQDPDVILVGEIRDEETAEIATHAALTGHLVLSTLHTNDAPSALTRLTDLGVPPYLIASTVAGVLAQRLIRRVCPACARAVAIGREHQRALRLGAAESGMEGVGCLQCRGTGYHGRLGLFEFMGMTERIREGMLGGETAGALRLRAEMEGLMALGADAAQKVRDGLTSPTEALRVLGLDGGGLD